jgi:hypothetical protein
MSKSKKNTGIYVDRKYRGLGDLFYIEGIPLGLATNLEDTKREPFHAVELFALPDLRYGWISIPKEANLSFASLNHNQLSSPVNYLIGWLDTNLYIYDLENQTILYQTSLDNQITSAIFINDATIACLVPSSSKPLKVIFYKSGVQKEYTFTGTCLASFKGRLFIGNGKILHFSGASITDPSFEDDPFSSTNGGGYLILNYPYVSKICYLLPWEDMLYIFTDGGVYILTVSLASNSPSTFYIIDAGINYDFSEAKILRIGDKTIVISKVGMFFMSGMNLERFDWVVSDQLPALNFTKAGCGHYQGQNFILVPYLEQEKTLVYSMEHGQFFFLPFKAINCIFTPSGKTYDFSRTNLRVLFADKSNFYKFSYTSVLHDYGQTRFKYIKEAWINGQGHFQVSFLYDIYGVWQSMYYCSLGPNILTYRSSFGRKGYKIGIQITSDESGAFAFVNKINLKVHVLGPINYFYYRCP